MGLIGDLAKNRGLINNYPASTNFIPSAVVEVGQQKVSVPQAEVTRDEVERLVGDLDSLYRTRANEEVAAIVAECFPQILGAMRWVKYEAKGEYVGQGGIGRQLVATALRPIDLGDPAITDSLSAGSTGLYGGTAQQVYSWLPSTAWTAGTAKIWFPSQTMAKEAAIVFCGFTEPEEIPKVDAVRFTVSSVNTPVLSLNFASQRRGGLRDPVTAKLPLPVIFGPQKVVASSLYPGKTGDSQPTPIAVLITMAENRTT